MPQLPQPATGASIIRRNVASAAMPLTLTPLSLHSFVAAVWSRINCYCLRHTKLIHRAELSNTSSEADKTVEFIHRISKPPLLASSCRAPVMIIVPRVVHKKWQCDLPLQNFCTENHWRINTSTLSHSKEWRLLNRLNSTQLNVRTSLTLASWPRTTPFLVSAPADSTCFSAIQSSTGSENILKCKRDVVKILPFAADLQQREWRGKSPFTTTTSLAGRLFWHVAISSARKTAN